MPSENSKFISARNIAFRRQSGKCYYCKRRIFQKHETEWYGAPLRRCTGDHFVPLAYGGETTVQNIVAACFECNHAKGDLLPSEFGPGFPMPEIKDPASIASIKAEKREEWGKHGPVSLAFLPMRARSQMEEALASIVTRKP